MSELKVDKVSPRSGNYVALNTVGSKNIIINGDMSIAQRGTSTASITSGDYYTVDRFELGLTTLGTWTQSQSTDVPTGQGFATSLKMDCTTADASPAANALFQIRQKIEGQNLQYLKKGTTNAESLTASFWVKSSKTGTYILEIFDNDNSRQISKTYTIDSASTWEKKTITFAGDTTGALDNDNGIGLSMQFWLGAGTDYTSGTLSTSWTSNTNANRAVGQVNLADNTANNFWITGVQLEAGTTASDFEFLPYDMNLARCQRYYYKTTPTTNGRIANGFAPSATLTDNLFSLPVTMRTNPTALEQSGTAGDYSVVNRATATTCSAVPAIQNSTNQTAGIRATVSSGLTTGDGVILRSVNTSGFLAWSAEL